MFRTTIEAALCLCLSPLLVAQQAAAANPVPWSSPVGPPVAKPGYVVIPGDTPVTLRLVHPLSSASAHVGDRVELELVNPILSDERVVIPAGAIFIARVSYADPKTPDHFGQVGFAIPQLNLGHHARVQLDDTNSAQRKDDRQEATEWIVIYSVFFPVFLLVLPFVLIRALSHPQQSPPRPLLDTTGVGTKDTLYPRGYEYHYYTRRQVRIREDRMALMYFQNVETAH